jgi:hypothetical protein
MRALGWTKLLLVVVVMTQVGAPVAWARITIQGTNAEKRQIQQAINGIKQASPTARRLFQELEQRRENVTIRFGDSIDIAVATGNNRMVILNKDAISRLKQIDRPAGGGRALEQTSLGHIIAHEALGHILNGLKRRPNGEDVAVAVENRIREEERSPKRTKYYERSGNKDTIPFDDGSRVDTTDALRRPKKAGGRPFARLEEDAFLDVSARLTPEGNVEVTLDPLAGTQQLALDLAEFGGGVELVDLLDLTATLAPSADPEFDLVVPEFVMEFESLQLGRLGPTGINLIELIQPTRTPIGMWDFAGPPPASPPPDGRGQDFSFEFAGDFRWTNPLFGRLDEEGYVLDSFMGVMIATSQDRWAGTSTVEGAKYAPVAVPATLVLLAYGVLALLLWQRRAILMRVTGFSAGRPAKSSIGSPPEG